MFAQQSINPFVSRVLAGGLVLLWFATCSAQAKEWRVSPGHGVLQAAIEAAHNGDTLVLSSGVYYGSINIDRSLSLLGNTKSIIDGEGSGHVITVSAPDALVSRMRIEHSGSNLVIEDSGVFITDAGDRARIEDNYFENNLFGINLKGPDSAIIKNNVIIGSRNHRINDRGNGIHLWNSPGSIVENNDIRYGRDGIFVTTSRNNVFHGNRLRDLRFAIHYMYTNDSEVSGNVSINNHVGYALMFSHHLKIMNNRSQGDHERGLFFNFANYSVIDGNRVTGGDDGGPEKCVFIYNSNFNQFTNNLFRDCQIGIHFTAGSESNEIYGNAFINNRTQVKYVGTRYIEWSKNGHGNYWSDNLAFDIDANGIADRPYRPNDLVDQIIWQHPLAKLLLNSPAVQILKWAQSEFPGIHPGGVTDSAPLIAPPEMRSTGGLAMPVDLSDV